MIIIIMILMIIIVIAIVIIIISSSSSIVVIGSRIIVTIIIPPRRARPTATSSAPSPAAQRASSTPPHHTPNLPTNITPTKIMLESNPLKSIMLVGKLAVQALDVLWGPNRLEAHEEPTKKKHSVPTKHPRPVCREFTKGGLLKGGLAFYVLLLCLYC